jgi:hypothetical protein
MRFPIADVDFDAVGRANPGHLETATTGPLYGKLFCDTEFICGRLSGQVLQSHIQPNIVLNRSAVINGFIF